MQNLKIIIKRTVQVALTANDWELTNGPGYEMREAVARDLNANLVHYCNLHHTDHEYVMEKMQYWFKQYEEFGATDIAVHRVLSSILDEVFA